jgi:predicted alpha/beta-fold hydrolase
MEDGGTVSIDWAQPVVEPNGVVVCLFPGMGAESEFAPIKSLVQSLQNAGFEIAVMHYRGVRDKYTSH